MTQTESVLVRDLVRRGEAELTTGPFGTQLKADEYVEDGIPLINVRNIGFGQIRATDLEYLSEATTLRLARHRLEAGDIVFGRKGAVERHAFVSNEQVGWVQGSDCLRLRLRSPHFEPRFVSYFLLTEHHQEWMKSQGSGGATMASLNQDILGRIALPLTALTTQRKIAAILSAYDSLIDDNNRRIKTLEEMAERIYREWFVDFRYPGRESVSLTRSEFGNQPSSWQVKSLRDVADVNARTIKPGQGPDEILYADISSVSMGRTAPLARMPFFMAPGRARRLVRHGDTIWSTVRPNRRSYALVIHPSPNLVVSTGFAVLSPTGVPYSFLYRLVTTEAFVGYLSNRATGAAYPAVTGGVFEAARVAIPPSELLDKFGAFVDPIDSLIASLERAKALLRDSRDLLLPRLISGEIDVEKLNIAIEDAAA